MVAARDIPVGEMLVVEEPLCSILAPEKLGLSSLLAPWIVLLFCRLARLAFPDMRIFLLPPEKLTNHCLHCHVFTKAPLPCEVTGILSWTLLSNLPTIVNRIKTITF